MAVSNRTLQAIKAAPLSQVMEACGAPLKRVGHEFLTQCLWHEDKHPSLTVSDDKGFSFCHVCRGGGDAIDYVSKRYGLGWRDAAEKAASILSIPFELDDEDPVASARRREELERARTALKSEQSKYKANLGDKRAGRIHEILKQRGLTPAASREFGLGYAPGGFFAKRITLPIYNHKNQLVGFTGRATDDSPAKYKNSADSDLFQKKSLVFNEARAKEAAREADSLIFVEGHLDVVSLWQHGVKNVVAMQGTGAPDVQIIQRLARSVKNFILCFDGDAGGKKATEQFISAAGKLALRGEININVAMLPQGMDPDEVVRSGQSLYDYTASAPSWLDWLIDEWAANLSLDDAAAITDVEGKVKALINQLHSKALRAHYIDKASRVLSKTDKEAAQLSKEWHSTVQVQSQLQWKPRSAWETRVAVERRMARLYVHKPGLRDYLRPSMQNIQTPGVLWLWKRIQELEGCCTIDLTPHSVMAVVCAAEPHFLQQLRTVVQPSVMIDDSEGVLAHITGIMGKEISYPDEPDTNQPSP
jgi:DNA primase